ncbi:MAG: hypothetical protein GC193_09965 [Cryomorphaceae bacterium]|nr:hypothetical protein [Cryomorphaceae bacterium]
MRILLFIPIVLFACNPTPHHHADSPLVNLDSLAIETTFADTNKVFQPQFPVLPDSSDYFIHFGEYAELDKTGRSWLKVGSSYSYDSERYNSLISNLAFQHKDSLQMRDLTNRKMLFSGFEKLHRTGNSQDAVMMYSALEYDSNKNGKVDFNDSHSVYLSKMDGTQFTRITPNGHHALDPEYYADVHILYQRSFIDLDSNLHFSGKDSLCLSYIDLNGGDFKLNLIIRKAS